jgi:mannose-1-phosphate guanylyltransferase
MRSNDYVIIMAGGIGSRFWPMSRNSLPKQFHDFLGTGRSLLQMTFDRFKGLVPEENILVVTNRQYRKLVQEHLPMLKPEQILGEPVGRNTAPCIAYGAFSVARLNPEACIFVAASDHLIRQDAKFRNDVELALDLARKESIILTMGIKPTRPDTGYGYIQMKDDVDSGTHFPVKTFTEKPDLEMAKTFLLSGEFVWNSGMLAFSLSTIYDALKTHTPEMFDLFQGIQGRLGTEDERAAVEQVYSQVRNESIDVAVMQKARNAWVIPASFDWSDVGTWGSLYDQMEKDYLGNAVKGRVMVYESNNNVVTITDPNKLVVLNGLDDFIVVDTGDVLLICKKGDEQMIKEIVADVRKSHGDSFA